MKFFETVLLVVSLIALAGVIGLLLKPRIPVERKSTKSKSMMREHN